MKVFVTGATGFVGLNIVKALLEAGYEAHAYVRPTSKLDYLKDMDVTYHQGELHDERALQAGMKGLDAVIHCAGVTSSYEKDFPYLRSINVEGTRKVIEAALASNIKRFVYTSTTSTIGAQNTRDKNFDESTPLGGIRARNPYGRSKLEAEHVIQEACEHGLEGIILNAAEVLGAYDYSMNWGSLVLAAGSGHVPFVPPGSGSFCSALEVGRCHVKALTKGQPGQRYILAGTDMLYADLITKIGEVCGCSFELPSEPYEAAYHQSILASHLAEYGNDLPMVDPYRMRVFKGHYLFDSGRAKQELGFEFAPIENMIQDAYNWYRAAGFIGA